jgi:hypothetical protein
MPHQDEKIIGGTNAKSIDGKGRKRIILIHTESLYNVDNLIVDILSSSFDFTTISWMKLWRCWGVFIHSALGPVMERSRAFGPMGTVMVKEPSSTTELSVGFTS